MRDMSPRQFIRYTRKLDKKGLAICDGCTESYVSAFDIFYPLFIVTGLSFFMWILLHWISFRLRNEK